MAGIGTEEAATRVDAGTTLEIERADCVVTASAKRVGMKRTRPRAEIELGAGEDTGTETLEGEDTPIGTFEDDI
jgi:hypothetical protein